MVSMTETTKQMLAQMYDAPDRHYHDMNHVRALLALLDQHRDKFSDPDVVEAAIWFHDCVYDTRSKDNEHQSAELAVAHLKSTCATESDNKRLQLVREMIEATSTHVAPQLSDPDELSDALLFLDMDLSVLGSDWASFDSYEAAVKKEYSWVSDEAWRKGRAAVLAKYQAKPHIFGSDIFRVKYEAQARQNIARSLERLQLQSLHITRTA